MAKMNKELMARLEGMQYAYDFAKKNGLDALEEEIKFRCNTKLPYTTNRQQVMDFQEMIKQRMLSTVALMSVLILREEFGFGSQRLKRFSDKFKDNTEQLQSGDLTWRDTYEAMVEEVGFGISIEDEVLDMEVE